MSFHVRVRRHYNAHVVGHLCSHAHHYRTLRATSCSQVDAVDIGEIDRHVIANVGVLQATLWSGNEEILQVSCVTQVTATGDGTLQRDIYNPLA